MLSYRHGFHAGNHADVLKHAIFVFLARHLQRKAGGVLFLDTHAGAGLYDLRAAAAEKTGEFREGIARVLPRKATAPALLRDYLALVEAWNPSAAPTTYPGSPALATEVNANRSIAARIGYMYAPGGAQAIPEFRATAARIKRVADFVREFSVQKGSRRTCLARPNARRLRFTLGRPHEQHFELGKKRPAIGLDRFRRFGASRDPVVSPSSS